MWFVPLVIRFLDSIIAITVLAGWETNCKKGFKPELFN